MGLEGSLGLFTGLEPTCLCGRLTTTYPLHTSVVKSNFSVVVVHRLAKNLCFKTERAGRISKIIATASALACGRGRVEEVTGQNFSVTVGEEGGIASMSGTGILSSSEL